MNMKGILAFTFLGLWTAGVVGLDICEDQINGARLAHPTDCSKYVVCQNQQTASFSACPRGLHFNRHIGECDLKSRAGCEAPQPKLSAAATSEGDSNCDCSSCCCCCNCNGPSTPGPTPGFPTDDDVSTPGSGPSTPEPTPGVPTDDDVSTPGSGPSTPEPTPGPGVPTDGDLSTPGSGPSTPGEGYGPSTPTPETPAPAPNPGCSNNLTICHDKPDGSHHLLPNECNQFVVCLNGCSVVMNCPANLQYSLKAGACVYPEESDCPWESTPPSGPSAGPSGIACNNPGKCAKQPNGHMFADPSSTGYIVCQCECEIAMPCATGTAFNPEKKTCDWPPKSDNGATNLIKCPEGLVYNATIGVCDWPLN